MRFALFLLFALSLSSLLKAQTPDPSVGPLAPSVLGARPTSTQQARGPKDSATKRAVHQLKMLEKQLHLNEDQVLQLQVILINRDIAMDSIARRPSVGPVAPPDSGRASDFRRTDGQARRSIQQDADQKINALLTDDQKPLYQQWKQQQKQKMQEKRQANQAEQLH